MTARAFRDPLQQLIYREGQSCKGCPHERTFEFIGSMQNICAIGKNHGYRCEQYGKRTNMTTSAIAADEIDAVLTEWYEWSEAYQPAVGYGRASAMFRDCRSSRQWMSYDEIGDVVDSQLRSATGQAVEPIIQTLSLAHRIAVMTAVRNFVAGAVVFTNPRSPATQDRDYAEAKALMRPALLAKGLICAP
ncbi:hypothetical protein BG57_03900 [Caballeronia grimmiae]|uniref:Uncharacterized protein n=2 Tax=Caballeronia grimmiae TaxID=1071679 RepID=A0A069PBR8_9BURK|nr:hypothetical protein BG57_03900 [Caballeronia grimmiae]GGD63268.1 hypothetical protein GCM10010985_16710 [Caballeronia grimmiae]